MQLPGFGCKATAEDMILAYNNVLELRTCASHTWQSSRVFDLNVTACEKLQLAAASQAASRRPSLPARRKLSGGRWRRQRRVCNDVSLLPACALPCWLAAEAKSPSSLCLDPHPWDGVHRVQGSCARRHQWCGRRRMTSWRRGRRAATRSPTCTLTPRRAAATGSTRCLSVSRHCRHEALNLQPLAPNDLARALLRAWPSAQAIFAHRGSREGRASLSIHHQRRPFTPQTLPLQERMEDAALVGCPAFEAIDLQRQGWAGVSDRDGSLEAVLWVRPGQ